MGRLLATLGVPIDVNHQAAFPVTVDLLQPRTAAEHIGPDLDRASQSSFSARSEMWPIFPMMT